MNRPAFQRGYLQVNPRQCHLIYQQIYPLRYHRLILVTFLRGYLHLNHHKCLQLRLPFNLLWFLPHHHRHVQHYFQHNSQLKFLLIYRLRNHQLCRQVFLQLCPYRLQLQGQQKHLLASHRMYRHNTLQTLPLIPH